ncbi:type II toxin-antitoxin system RelE/ParE family toxin [Sphingomonas sp.]|uniref:type II toxin-antitoxin system RelE/ParE family toxin n=1 Tax=Sphingomonas sp. TaxID=28214 RepID=UPI0035BBB691
MIVRFLASARADLDDIYFYVAQFDADAADRLVDRLRGSTRRLIDHPESAPTRRDIASDARGISVSPYVVLYRIGSAEVQVVRVVRASRDMSAIDF